MGEIQARYKVYAPESFLIGQAEGRSDISTSINPTKFWIPPRPDAPVVLLRAPKVILPELQRLGFHTGYNRDRATNIDVGLRDLFKKSEDEWIFELRKWLDMLQWEVASMDRSVCTVWHPLATYELLTAATGARIIEIDASTAEEAVTALPLRLKNANGARRRNVVVLLRGHKNIVQRLRRSGFHTGFWRDGATDVDNGLIRIFKESEPVRRTELLKDWLCELQRESECLNAVVAVWHPAATKELIESATELPVVEIDAQDMSTALARWRSVSRELLTRGGERADETHRSV
jgi:hypothetical protein